MNKEITITPEEREEIRARLERKYADPCREVQDLRIIVSHLLYALKSAEARADELEIYISKLVYELTDGNLSKPYDVQVIADEVSRIWQEYTDTKVAEAIAEAEAENEKLPATLEAARQAVEGGMK